MWFRMKYAGVSATGILPGNVKKLTRFVKKCKIFFVNYREAAGSDGGGIKPFATNQKKPHFFYRLGVFR
jgi:hypothetical protein